MKIIILSVVVLFTTYQNLFAQQFVTKATVLYEVKTNYRKTLGNNSWDEMMKDNMSKFKTGFYKFSFAGSRSIFKFDHWDANSKIPEWVKKSDEGNEWFLDYSIGKLNMKKVIVGSDFVVNDSIPKIEWQLSNESLVIAGYNCRKATGKIFDSVYVFAFYSDEITLPGGPCSISGLPGLILGLTIPRLYTSWIATKVDVGQVDEKALVPITSKKYYTIASLRGFVLENTKDWYSEDDPNSKNEIAQFLWSTAL